MTIGSKIVLFFLVLFSTQVSYARLIQIIHTNDLHSYFEGYQDGRGSYARVMTKIKEIRAEAKAKGIEVLQIDGGDWGEGTSFFLADSGADTIRALSMLGAEVAVIGNHDHLLGGQSLGEQIRRANTKTKFVSANIKFTPEMNIGDSVVPSVDIDRAGIKIRIIGLTTSESFFQYSMLPGRVRSPVPIGVEESDKARADGKELVIALTHIGKYMDNVLAESSKNIDLIVGGHSHLKLTDVSYRNNKNGKAVPIVQAWAHGLAVGSLILDVSDSGEVSVKEYKMHEVDASIDPDPVMAAFVERSKPHRNENLGGHWDEVIGHTEVPMTGYKDGMPVYRTSCWSRHMARAIRKGVGASLGIHAASFEGVNKEPGPITRADLADNFSHLNRFGEKGWEIATIGMSGWKLKPFLWYLSRWGPGGVTFSGLGYGWTGNSGFVSDIDAESLAPEAYYRIAIPRVAAEAIKNDFPGYRKYLSGLKYTGKFYWPVIEEYLKENSPIRCD